MQSKIVKSVILSVLLAAPVLVGLVPTAASQTLPDTTCQSAVGVGALDIPHAYETANGIVTTTNDACPTHYSGELGFGIGGVWLFAREGPSANGGDGVVACYGSTTPGDGPTTGHHGGTQNTINVQDDVLGSNVAFTITRDYNRSATDPFLPAGNNNGDFDCGDSLVEPCADPGDENVAPGCNVLDASQFVSAGAGTWTVSGTLEDYAGADGAIVVFIENGLSPSTATTGAAWTSTVVPACLGVVTSSAPIRIGPAAITLTFGPNCTSGSLTVQGSSLLPPPVPPLGVVTCRDSTFPAAGSTSSGNPVTHTLTAASGSITCTTPADTAAQWSWSASVNSGPVFPGSGTFIQLL